MPMNSKGQPGSICLIRSISVLTIPGREGYAKPIKEGLEVGIRIGNTNQIKLYDLDRNP